MNKIQNKTDFNYLKQVADDNQTKNNLEEIEKDWKKVREEGKTIKNKRLLKLKLNGKTFFTHKNEASSTIDTYIEIFKEKAHTCIKGFDGKKAKVVIDLGANEGYYTIKLKENNPKLKIIAVEPVKSTFLTLKKNILVNKLKNVEVVKAAIGNSNKIINFEMYPGSTMICAKNIKLQKRGWVKNNVIKKVKVKQITLPSLCKKFKIKKIDILKLDVECSEYEILSSSVQVLKNVDRIVLEWHTKELRDKCKRLLKKEGFKIELEENKKCGNIYFKK